MWQGVMAPSGLCPETGPPSDGRTEVIDPLAICLLAAALTIADALAQPPAASSVRLRSGKGIAVLLGVGTGLLGVVVVITGNWLASAVLVATLAGLLTLVSNIKRRVLGEPLVFSDFALIGAVFQHPQFYLTALRPWQSAVVCAALGGIIAVIISQSNDDLAARIAGAGLSIAAVLWLRAALRTAWWNKLGEDPALDRDVGEHGLIAILVVYWWLWTRQAHPTVCDLPAVAGEHNQLVVIVQCESFADPADLFGQEHRPLSGLMEARKRASRSGRLMVPGFGAYTMRTEFGVLFGIPESRLALNRFDPFLTAMKAASWALPNRLRMGEWTCVFLHPHDMRFYRRNRLMPAAGFDALIGEEAFADRPPDDGRYVSDAAVCDKVMEIGAGIEGRGLIYAVTIENHGPWAAGSDGKDEYLRLLKRSDAMLSRLVEELPRLERPVILCFFGDHRPSIPAVSLPGGERHTPYVIVKFDRDGKPVIDADPVRDLTPAELHGEILEAIGSGGG